MLKGIGIAAALVTALFIVGVLSAAVGPQWRVDDVTGHSVTCHERWHPANVRTVTVKAFSADGLRSGDLCPG
jgi:hypothetical protein